MPVGSLSSWNAAFSCLPENHLRKSAVDVHADHVLHLLLLSAVVQREQWATRQLLEGWEATPHQQLERLLRETNGQDEASRHGNSRLRLRLTALGYKFPDEFMLRISGNGPSKAYKVIWRIGHEVGARSIDFLPSTKT
jgi:hypothetical protein